MGLRAVFSRRFTKSKLWDICRALRLHDVLDARRHGDGDLQRAAARPNDADNPVRMVIDAGMPAAIWEAVRAALRRARLRMVRRRRGRSGVQADRRRTARQLWKAGPRPRDEDRRRRRQRMSARRRRRDRLAAGAAANAADVEYFENAEASSKKTRGGWLRSGDMGHRDADGWLFFDYRKGGSIRHNGDFINTGFVEKVIAEHPAVSDVFVYGVPAASGAPGEKDVVAAIVPWSRARLRSRGDLRRLPQGTRAELRAVVPAGGRRDSQDRVGEAAGALPDRALRRTRRASTRRSPRDHGNRATVTPARCAALPGAGGRE